MVYTVSMQHSIKEVTAKDSSTSFPSMETFSGVALFFWKSHSKDEYDTVTVSYYTRPIRIKATAALPESQKTGQEIAA